METMEIIDGIIKNYLLLKEKDPDNKMLKYIEPAGRGFKIEKEFYEWAYPKYLDELKKEVAKEDL